MGPCIANIFQYMSNKMHLYTVFLYLETAVHVSGGSSTHHQERIQLYLQHLVFVTPVYFLYLETALHVSGGSSTHHQERINCIYSIWYLSHRYCYLPLSWRSSSFSTIAVGSSNGVTNTRCCRYTCI